MATYPGALYAGVTVTDGVDNVQASDHNTQDAEIIAIETELGTDPAGSKTDVKTRLAVSLANDGTLEFADSTVLTISSGEITLTQNWHRVATEGGAGTDFLDTISGLANDGAVVFLRPSTSNDIVIRDGQDNIECIGGANITLSDTDEWAIGVYDGNLSAWLVGRLSGGTDITGSGTANTLPKFSASTTLADSTITDDGTDIVLGGNVTIGDGTADTDFTLTFDGETNDLVITGMEDEDYIQFSDDILMATTEKVQFRDTAIHISSIDDGHLDLTADVAVDVNGALTSTPDEITATSEGVAASVTTLNTEVTTNGDSDLDNVTLANGISGQVKNIYCVVEGNAADTWKITPATMAGGTQITFAGIGEGCTLVYADNEGWCVVANNGGTIT